MNAMKTFRRFALLALPLAFFAFSAPTLAAGGGGDHAAEAAHDGGDHGGGDHGGGGHGGGHGDDHGIPWLPIGQHALNLAILLGFLGFVLRKTVPDALKTRSAEVAAQIKESGERRSKAQARYDELQGRLDDFETELARLKAEGEAQAKRERDAVLARGDASAAAIADSAQRTIHAESLRAQQTLRAEAARLAVELAADHIKSSMTDADNARLTSDFISSLSAQGGGKGASHG